jgi:catechol 2,3-dioxygenase-like lactoylglutathione lyase family enzyme
MTAPGTTAGLITGVDFVTVPAKDFEASVHFYGTVLGLPAGGAPPHPSTK